MSKPYSEVDLSTQITEDLTWRLREISDLKVAIRRADVNLQKVLLRALITICYAHWEGYVRFSAKKYMEHVALRKFRYIDLNRQFFRNLYLPRLAALSNSKTSVAERCALVEEILEPSGRRYTKVNEDLINTKSNLNSEVLSDICIVCDISRELFEDKSTFIDVILLKRRNAIAHGEEALIALDELNEITEETISLMRKFGNALENHACLQTYKSQSNSNI
jgi:hypothetical protein